MCKVSDWWPSSSHNRSTTLNKHLNPHEQRRKHVTSSKNWNPSKSSDHIFVETEVSSDSVVDSKVKKKVGTCYDVSCGKNTVSTPEKILICIWRSPEAVVYDSGTEAIHSDLLGS